MKRYIPISNRKALREAVVYPDEYMDNIKYKIENSYKRLKNKTIDSIKICKILSILFVRNKISFEFQKNIDMGTEEYIKYGINEGGTLPDKYGSIRVFCNVNILNILKSQKFYDRFKELLLFVLKHELIHRGQVLRVKDKELRAEVLKKEYEGDKVAYLSDKQEIMSYAWEVVELLRIKGLTEIEIENLMKNDLKQLRMISDVFKTYTDYFTKEDWQLNLFYKYMYMYLQ